MKYYNTVQYFEDHDAYISLDGHYSSYNGVDYDYTKVRPKEKTITVYE